MQILGKITSVKMLPDNNAIGLVTNKLKRFEIKEVGGV